MSSAIPVRAGPGNTTSCSATPAAFNAASMVVAWLSPTSSFSSSRAAWARRSCRCAEGDARTLGQFVMPGGQSRNDSTSVPIDVADSAASGHKRKSIGPDQLTAALMRLSPVTRGRGWRACRRGVRRRTTRSRRARRIDRVPLDLRGGADPAHRRLHVVDRGRIRVLRSQPVVHREGDVTEHGQLHAVADEVRLVAAPPRATVHEHETGRFVVLAAVRTRRARTLVPTLLYTMSRVTFTGESGTGDPARPRPATAQAPSRSRRARSRDEPGALHPVSIVGR